MPGVEPTFKRFASRDEGGALAARQRELNVNKCKVIKRRYGYSDSTRWVVKRQ